MVKPGYQNRGKKYSPFVGKLDSRNILYLGSMKDYYLDSIFEELKDSPDPLGNIVEVNIVWTQAMPKTH